MGFAGTFYGVNLLPVFTVNVVGFADISMVATLVFIYSEYSGRVRADQKQWQAVWAIDSPAILLPACSNRQSCWEQLNLAATIQFGLGRAAHASSRLNTRRASAHVCPSFSAQRNFLCSVSSFSFNMSVKKKNDEQKF